MHAMWDDDHLTALVTNMIHEWISTRPRGQKTVAGILVI